MFFSDIFKKNTNKNIRQEFTNAQKEQIELGYKNGLSKRQVDYYSDPSIDFMDMQDIREQLKYTIDVPFLIEKYRPIIIHNNPPKYNGLVATYGGIFGDIAGSRYEFGYSNKVRESLTFENIDMKTSRITDDTVLILATLDSIQNKDITTNLIELANQYDGIFKDEKIPFGNTLYTENYKKYFKEYSHVGYGGSFYQWGLIGNGPYHSFGNGSAMRIAPIGECFDNIEYVILNAIASAGCTHNHPEGIKGAVVTAVCIWMCRHNYTKEEILDYVKIHYQNSELIKVYTMEEVRACNQQGYGVTCQFSVPAAITCFVESDSYEKCIENAISFEGDSDTIAAIAGAISAAYYGNISDNIKNIIFEKIPDKLKKLLL